LWAGSHRGQYACLFGNSPDLVVNGQTIATKVGSSSKDSFPGHLNLWFSEDGQHVLGFGQHTGDLVCFVDAAITKPVIAQQFMNVQGSRMLEPIKVDSSHWLAVVKNDSTYAVKNSFPPFFRVDVEIPAAQESAEAD